MPSRRTLVAAVFLASLFGSAGSALAANVQDTHGREWRQLYETTGLSWNQVDSVCPT